MQILELMGWFIGSIPEAGTTLEVITQDIVLPFYQQCKTFVQHRKTSEAG